MTMPKGRDAMTITQFVTSMILFVVTVSVPILGYVKNTSEDIAVLKAQREADQKWRDSHDMDERRLARIESRVEDLYDLAKGEKIGGKH